MEARSTLFWSRIITLLCCLSSLAVEAAAVISLQPDVVSVNTNSWANFTCSLSCAHQHTHTIYWLVGDFSFDDRFVWLSPHAVEEEYFTSRTGIQLRIEQEINCAVSATGMVKQTLRINATSLDLNKTPIQCAAIGKTQDHSNYLSFYSVLKVQDPTPKVETITPSPTGCPKTAQEVDGIAVTKTITTTVTVINPSPTPSLPGMQMATDRNSGSSLTAAASLTLVGLLVHLLCHFHW